MVRPDRERTSENTSVRVYLRKMLFALLLLVLLTFGCIVSFLGARAILDNDNDIVDFYGHIMTLREFKEEAPNGGCVVLSSGVNRLVRKLTHQPVSMCFDNMYDLDQWYRSHPPPYQ